MIKILLTEMKIFWNWWHFNNNEFQIFIFRPVIWLDCTFTDTCFNKYQILGQMSWIILSPTINKKLICEQLLLRCQLEMINQKPFKTSFFFYQQLLFKLVAMKENSNMALEIFNVESVKSWLNWMIIILKYILIFPF